MSKGKLVLFNGEVFDEGESKFRLNRALKFGDGLFETIKIINGEPHLWHYHIERLKAGMHFLYFDFDPLFFDELLVDVHSLILQKEMFLGGRLRITVFRSSKGNYTPYSNEVDYFIELEDDINGFKLNKKGLKIDISDSVKIFQNDQNQYKTLNSLNFIRASVEKQKRGFDDLLLVNQNGNIAEATSSNLFLVKNNQCFTPPIQDGGINGVMRLHIINLLRNANIELRRKSLTVRDLELADEVFLTNSISGVQWVGAFKKQRYFHKVSSQMLSLLGKD